MNDLAGTTRVESMGSVWLIDNDLHRCCRFPKNEGPRASPEWGNADAGPPQDAVWHDFAGEWTVANGRLFIEVEFREGHGWFGVKAPNAVVLSGESA